MKKFLFLLVLLSLTTMTFGQGKLKGFFKPVTYDTPSLTTRALGEATNIWLLRPIVTLSAVQFTWDKDLKQFNSNAFSSTGMGISYAHYIDVNNEPYNNFGFNFLVLMNTSTIDDPTSISLAGTISALKFVSLGGGYDLGRKVVFFLTGVSYSF